jgi:diguanylate cyclase (GGDEF)-like protein/PAS domain S-box-containing protein
LTAASHATGTGTALFRFLTAILAFFAALCVSAAMAAPSLPPTTEKNGFDFSQTQGVVDLGSWLKPYRAPASVEQDGSSWYTMTATNSAERPSTRIFRAMSPPGAILQIIPRHGPPALLQVASSDAGVTVEPARAFGRHAFAITIPPATTATIAIRVVNTDPQPTLRAWTVPALVLHNRQLAILLAAVAGLIAASIAITTGVAVMTAHLASRWAAIVLLAVFFVELTSSGLFETGWIAVGGPYGFSAMMLGLTLAAGIRLVDLIAPFAEVWPKAPVYLLWSQRALLALCALAFLGFPGAVLVVESIVVVASALLTVYLVQRGLTGARAARVVAPSAAVFSLVAFAAAVVALGGFQDNPAAPAVIGGFAAVGAVLLALAICAGEGIAILSGPRLATVAVMPTVKSPPDADKGTAIDGAASRAIGASHQGVFDLDLATDSLRLSSEAALLIGFNDGSKTFSHEAWIARIHTDDRDTYSAALSEYRSQPGLAFRMEFRVRSESGRYPWFELRATMIGKNAAARCLGLIADISTRKQSEAAAMLDRPLNDALTGLGNRLGMMEELEQLGDGLRNMAFAILDIDRFKSIHASLGDAGGDHVLMGVADRLTKKLGSRARIFRIGGDSFAVLAALGNAQAGGLGAELVDLCARPFVYQARDIYAPASVGVASGADAEDSLELIKNAELALLQAKRQGGACARVYTHDLEAFAPGDAVALETDLRRALEAGEFELYYQPIVHVANGTIAGFEALLRWKHPVKGLLLPAEFIGHAEETGLIVSLGKFALEESARNLADWQQYFPIDPPLFVSVNVSRRQLRDPEFETLIAGLTAHGDLQPATLKLEITESAVATSEDAPDLLARLKAMGVGIGLDDFGTGLSSLGQLKDVPFDILKIDKSFLSVEGGRAEDGTAILNSIVALARDLKRVVVIEGIESEDDAARARATGCEYGQGFYFSVPLFAAEALNFIARHYGPEPQEPVSGATGVG